jgi:hypothetical protein
MDEKWLKIYFYFELTIIVYIYHSENIKYIPKNLKTNNNVSIIELAYPFSAGRINHLNPWYRDFSLAELCHQIIGGDENEVSDLKLIEFILQF